MATDRQGNAIVLNRAYVLACNVTAERGPNHVEIDLDNGTGSKMLVHARGLIPIERVDDIVDDAVTVSNLSSDDATDGYVLAADGSGGVAWVEPTAGSGVTDHGELDGLTDDDHTIYVKADGTRAFTGNVAIGTDAGGDRTLSIYSANASTNIAIGTTGATAKLNIIGTSTLWQMQLNGTTRGELTSAGWRVIGGAGGAAPCLRLEQNATTHAPLGITATSTADDTGSLLQVGTLVNPGSITGWVKVLVTDAAGGNPLSGNHYIPIYSVPTA